MTGRRRAILWIVAVGALVAGGFYVTRTPEGPGLTTQTIGRGDIVDAVGATGTIEAVTTVQVGTQVSGTIQALYADFNATVHKGQVIARLDESLFATQVEQARASLIRAEADRDRLQLSAEDARRKLDQARRLAAGGLISTSELDTADSDQRGAAAQVRSAEAQVTQARASLNQAEVSLSKTVIAAPIDGIVIARNVDIGQTVAASLQAPTLFVIAADLTKMRVNASINEADVGRVRPGQTVRFHVDAFPGDQFVGSLSLVRLSPVVQQNVVTYAALIDVPNPMLKLKPGMTATVEIEIAARRHALRVPNAALRFRPTDEILAAFARTSPPRASAAPPDTAIPSTPPDEVEESNGQIWILAAGALTPVRVALGITDGSYTELLAPDIAEGTVVVTGIAAGAAASSPAAGTVANPLMGPQRGQGPRGGR